MDLRLLNAGNSADRAQTYACNLGNVGANSIDAFEVVSREIAGLTVSADDYQISAPGTPVMTLPRAMLSFKARPKVYRLNDSNGGYVISGAENLNYRPLARLAVGQVIEFFCSGQVATNDGVKDYIIAPWFDLAVPSSQAVIFGGLDLQATDTFAATSFMFSSVITITAVTPTTFDFSYTSRRQRSWNNVTYPDETFVQSGGHDGVPYDSAGGLNPFTSLTIFIGDGGIASGKYVDVVVGTSYVRLLAGPSGYVLPSPTPP
jgi:hypothetical protein